MELYYEIFNLTGKKAIITGGSSGLGHGMADALLRSGCEIVIVGSSQKGEKIVEDYRAEGLPAHFVKGDLSKREEVSRSFEEALLLLNGRLDILVNSAGVQRRYPSEDFPIEEWDLVMAVNLDALWLYCQMAGRVMLKQGYGKIINVASVLSYDGGFTVPAYTATKGAVAQVTKALANEWAGRGVNINAIAPGYMDTPLNVNLVNNPERNADIMKRIPQGRWGSEEDVKGAAVFLASDASGYVNGTLLLVDGGYSGR